MSNSGRVILSLPDTSTAFNDWNPSGNHETEVHHKLGKLVVHLGTSQPESQVLRGDYGWARSVETVSW
jgi:hypothetical protein